VSACEICVASRQNDPGLKLHHQERERLTAELARSRSESDGLRRRAEFLEDQLRARVAPVPLASTVAPAVVTTEAVAAIPAPPLAAERSFFRRRKPS